MRYIMKGGVWKNSEDQILKAAIMKYGFNQWSRISSLLPRKSAKQCKQRWYEWLDPSIKKTEWTRDEDQKLLQLARVFPSQWRTIAPFVGRTPAQCYERYEKLLDIAQGKDPNETNQLRKLKPKEIDPNPETKPARPDPIDMDEDEKQMLAEVRVRLANTKGKKAKRKEREKYIDEARRLARLQKARELMMAGVENIMTQQQQKRLRQRRDINYNKEVPFKRDVPEFVYETEKTQSPSSGMFALNMSLQALEGKRRDAEQEQARKQDKKRIKKLQEKDPLTLINTKQFSKPSPIPISLSTPQLNDRDLEELKRLNLTTPLNTILQSQVTPAMTPHNRLMFEARVNYSLNSVAPGEEAEDDVDGVEGLMRLKDLKKQESMMRGINREGLTPSLASRINTPVSGWDSNNGSKLKGLFKGLTKPENVVEFEIPEEEQEDQKEEMMDAEQYQKQEAEKQKMILEKKLEERSEVLKKELPRVKIIPHFVDLYGDVDNLIGKQYVSLVYSEAVDYPVQGIELPNEVLPYKQDIAPEYLEQARKLIEVELSEDRPDIYQKIQEARRHVNYDSKTKRWTYNLNEQKNYSHQYQAELPKFKQLKKQVQSLEKKTGKFLGGYQALIQKNSQQLNTLIAQYQDLLIKQQVIVQLRSQEQRSITSQLQQLKSYYQMIYKSV